MKSPLWLTYRCWKNGSGLGTCTHTFHSLRGRDKVSPPDLLQGSPLPSGASQGCPAGDSASQDAPKYLLSTCPLAPPALSLNVHICKQGRRVSHRLPEAHGACAWQLLPPEPDFLLWAQAGQRASSFGLRGSVSAPSAKSAPDSQGTPQAALPRLRLRLWWR